jgi:hypothetical protein
MANSTGSIYLGVILIIGSVVFLLSGLGALYERLTYSLWEQNMDIILAFLLLMAGLIFLFKETKL